MNDILKTLNETSSNTLMETLEISYTEFTDGVLTAKMPVNSNVHQPYGLLHGGASAALAETVGSVLSGLEIDPKTQGAVGMNLNIYHLNSIRKGEVIAKASFIRKGNSTHVVKIDIHSDEGKLISHAILTNKIISSKSVSS